MDCRSEDRRKQIVEDYDVVPKVHIKLLAGQIKESDAGGIIKNDYYIFEAVHRKNGNSEIILCGMGAARDFLKLLNHRGLHIFNPLHGGFGYAGGDPQEGEVAEGHGNGDLQRGEGGRGRRNRAWNPIAQQLYHACMWVIIIIDAKGGTPIFEIQERVYNFRDRIPFESQVKGVNTIIRKNMQGRTLTEEIDRLRGNNDIRNELCQFDMLVNVINNLTDESGNHIQSYF